MDNTTQKRKQNSSNLLSENKVFKQKFAAWFWTIVAAGMVAIICVFWMIT
jgi:hypothetical protein